MAATARPTVPGRALVPSLLLLTAVTGVGNVVFLGFALAGAPGLSAGRCAAAVAGFLTGAAFGVVLLGHSLAPPLAVCAAGTCACAVSVSLEGRRGPAVGI
jgi:uncharacterized membrane protein YoaK (UPF0700 family)